MKKKLFILGNWKSHKSIADARTWIERFTLLLPDVPEHIQIIMCPAYHHLNLFGMLPERIGKGVQDVSPFEEGAYTGEIAASMVRDMVQFALLGHSERRSHFGESDEYITQKVKQVMAVHIAPIVCVSEAAQVNRLRELVPAYASAGLLLYEPLSAVGTGNADSPQNANAAAGEISAILPSVPILYGGSVVPENVKSFTDQENLSGVGVGGASLDPLQFFQLIQAVL